MSTEGSLGPRISGIPVLIPVTKLAKEEWVVQFTTLEEDRELVRIRNRTSGVSYLFGGVWTNTEAIPEAVKIEAESQWHEYKSLAEDEVRDNSGRLTQLRIYDRKFQTRVWMFDSFTPWENANIPRDSEARWTPDHQKLLEFFGYAKNSDRQEPKGAMTPETLKKLLSGVAAIGDYEEQHSREDELAKEVFLQISKGSRHARKLAKLMHDCMNTKRVRHYA